MSEKKNLYMGKKGERQINFAVSCCLLDRTKGTREKKKEKEFCKVFQIKKWFSEKKRKRKNKIRNKVRHLRVYFVGKQNHWFLLTFNFDFILQPNICLPYSIRYNAYAFFFLTLNHFKMRQCGCWIVLFLLFCCYEIWWSKRDSFVLSLKIVKWCWSEWRFFLCFFFFDVTSYIVCMTYQMKISIQIKETN